MNTQETDRLSARLKQQVNRLFSAVFRPTERKRRVRAADKTSQAAAAYGTEAYWKAKNGVSSITYLTADDLANKNCTLTAGTYYVKDDITCIGSSTAAGGSGFQIRGHVTLILVKSDAKPNGPTIPPACAAANSGSPCSQGSKAAHPDDTGGIGGAGIYVPANSTLTLLGVGTVKATGGIGGAGGNGGDVIFV